MVEIAVKHRTLSNWKRVLSSLFIQMHQGLVFGQKNSIWVEFLNLTFRTVCLEISKLCSPATVIIFLCPQSVQNLARNFRKLLRKQFFVVNMNNFNHFKCLNSQGFQGLCPWTPEGELIVPPLAPSNKCKYANVCWPVSFGNRNSIFSTKMHHSTFVWLTSIYIWY